MSAAYIQIYLHFGIKPLVSWVRCGSLLYRFLIFAPLLTLMNRASLTKKLQETRSIHDSMNNPKIEFIS